MGKSRSRFWASSLSLLALAGMLSACGGESAGNELGGGNSLQGTWYGTENALHEIEFVTEGDMISRERRRTRVKEIPMTFTKMDDSRLRVTTPSGEVVTQYAFEDDNLVLTMEGETKRYRRLSPDLVEARDSLHMAAFRFAQQTNRDYEWRQLGGVKELEAALQAQATGGATYRITYASPSKSIIHYEITHANAPGLTCVDEDKNYDWTWMYEHVHGTTFPRDIDYDAQDKLVKEMDALFEKEQADAPALRTAREGRTVEGTDPACDLIGRI